jgi:hypothetical protein
MEAGSGTTPAALVSTTMLSYKTEFGKSNDPATNRTDRAAGKERLPLANVGKLPV